MHEVLARRGQATLILKFDDEEQLRRCCDLAEGRICVAPRGGEVLIPYADILSFEGLIHPSERRRLQEEQRELTRQYGEIIAEAGRVGQRALRITEILAEDQREAVSRTAEERSHILSILGLPTDPWVSGPSTHEERSE